MKRQWTEKEMATWWGRCKWHRTETGQRTQGGEQRLSGQPGSWGRPGAEPWAEGKLRAELQGSGSLRPIQAAWGQARETEEGAGQPARESEEAWPGAGAHRMPSRSLGAAGEEARPLLPAPCSPGRALQPRGWKQQEVGGPGWPSSVRAPGACADSVFWTLGRLAGPASQRPVTLVD